MKATGIIRRIDELGRIVLPKELRSTYKIKEGTPLEIFIGECGELILKKYSLIGELGAIASECCEALYESLSNNIIITDKEKIIAIKGEIKKNIHNENISSVNENFIEQRKSFIKDKKRNLEIDKIIDCENEIFGFAFVPIIVAGDAVGSVIFVNLNSQNIIDDSVLCTLKTVALILSKQIV